MLAYSPGVLILVILIPTDSVAQSADVYYRVGSAQSAYRIYIRRVFVTLAFKNGTVIKGDSVRQSECSRVISQYSGIIYIHFMLINGIVVYFETSYGITYNRYTELAFSTRNARLYPVGVADGPNIVAVYIQLQLIVHIIDGCRAVIRGYDPAVLHGYCKGRTNVIQVVNKMSVSLISVGILYNRNIRNLNFCYRRFLDYNHEFARNAEYAARYSVSAAGFPICRFLFIIAVNGQRVPFSVNFNTIVLPGILATVFKL